MRFINDSFLMRIETVGPKLRAMFSWNKDAVKIAQITGQTRTHANQLIGNLIKTGGSNPRLYLQYLSPIIIKAIKFYQSAALL